MRNHLTPKQPTTAELWSVITDTQIYLLLCSMRKHEQKCS